MYDDVLFKLDEMLYMSTFLCTRTLSYVDIVYFFEIYAVFYLDKYELEAAKFKNLFKWVDRMSNELEANSIFSVKSFEKAP